MGWIRPLIRCRVHGLASFRRIFGHARRPYFLFGLGAALLCFSYLSLHHVAGVKKVQRSPGELPPVKATRRVDSTESLTVRPPSRLALSPNGSHPHTALVDEMERQLRQMQKRIKLGRFRITAPEATNASLPSHFRYRELAATQAQRQERIRQVCQAKQLQEQKGKRVPGEVTYHEGWYGRKFLYAVMEVYEPQNFFFCPVLKVGSTFFRRLFYAMNYGLKISSPYDIPIDTALGKRARHPSDLIKGAPVPNKPAQRAQSARGRSRRAVGRQLRSVEDLDSRAPPAQRQPYTPQEDKRMRDFLDNAAKVMFTRDPYSKLFSGYMDKLFAPNTYFWGTVGIPIIKRFRPNASPTSLRCGHDVTFPEFIKYVIENERNDSASRDTHFVPSYDQCKPCDFRYDLVGKLETFPADVSLLLAQLGHNVSQNTLDAWSHQSDKDAIADSVTTAYKYWRRGITRCMSWAEANQRIWRKLQTRGLVDKDQPLPAADFQMYSASAVSFIEKASQYWRRFRTSGLQSRQKKEALSSAFSVIPRQDLEKVREFFSLDLDLFQYDPEPDSVFKAQKTWDVFALP